MAWPRDLIAGPGRAVTVLSFTQILGWGILIYPPVLMMPLIVQGVAMSVFFVSMLTILLNGVPPQRVPAASGLSNFARITAGSFAYVYRRQREMITALRKAREKIQLEETRVFDFLHGLGAALTAASKPSIAEYHFGRLPRA